MADSTRGRAVLRRAVAEHRGIVVTLAVALGVNLLVYTRWVYPLSERVGNIEQRDRAAERALAQARIDHAQASGTLTGKTRASAQLRTFYEDLLPRNLAGGRRLEFVVIDSVRLTAARSETGSSAATPRLSTSYRESRWVINPVPAEPDHSPAVSAITREGSQRRAFAAHGSPRMRCVMRRILITGRKRRVQRIALQATGWSGRHPIVAARSAA